MTFRPAVGTGLPHQPVHLIGGRRAGRLPRVRPRFAQEAFESTMRIVDVVKEIAVGARY